MSDAGRQRLDQKLVELGHYASRSRARDAIARGCIKLNGQDVSKAGMLVGDGVVIAIADQSQNYVSRAALKLLSALDVSGFDPVGQVCLDIGASTGGFTQVLLERGASRVFSVDVGHGQLSDVLASNDRVNSLEGKNIRDLNLDDLDGLHPSFLVCDVSFISLRLALPGALALAAEQAQGIFLVKPQFEVGRDHIGKGGLVKDAAFGKECARGVADWFDTLANWRLTHFMSSPVLGADGNKEYIMAGEKHV